MKAQIDGDRISGNILANFFYAVKLRSELSLVKVLVGTSLFTLELEAFVRVCGEHNTRSSGFYLKINSASQVFGDDLGYFLLLT
jgi:hypothetical protein